MEVSVEHLGAVQFEIKARQHVIASDQPLANGGFDEGMTPPELMLAALGSCAAYYVAEYLRDHQLALAGTRVVVSAQKAQNPPRMDKFEIKIEAPATLTAEHRQGIETAVHRCLIHNTLTHRPQIAILVNG
jgi:putative redox protein